MKGRDSAQEEAVVAQRSIGAWLAGLSRQTLRSVLVLR